MEDSTKQKLSEAGVDIKSAMERFLGNEALLIRFLKKFSQDANYELLRTSMEEKRYEDAFKAAHTLKGVCGNLSLIRLFEVVDRVVEYLRGKQYAEAEALMPQVVQEYEKISDILKTL